MKVREIFRCDCCEKEGTPGVYWADNWNGGIMTIVQDGCNGKMEFEHLCPGCRHIISKEFYETVGKLRPKKP